MTNEEKANIRTEARAEGFEDGVIKGREVADSIDARVYTDTTALDYAGVFAFEYVRAYFEGFERAFKRRADENDRFRYDIRINAQRKQKEEPSNEQ